MSALRIRTDLNDAITATLNSIADCGTWWTGPQRVSIAQATLGALRCMQQADAVERDIAERDEAEAGSADVTDEITGEHQYAGELSAEIVETIHCITAASGSLSKQWVQGVLEHMEAGAFVELVAVVAVTVTIDTIFRVTGLPMPAFPASRGGKPSRYRPAGLHTDVCWVPTIDPAAVGASEMDLFPGRGRPNVGRPLTMVPDAWRMFDRLNRPAYLPFHVVPNVQYEPHRAISRRQMEMIATRVSAHNECFY